MSSRSKYLLIAIILTSISNSIADQDRFAQIEKDIRYDNNSTFIYLSIPIQYSCNQFMQDNVTNKSNISNLRIALELGYNDSDGVNSSLKGPYLENIAVSFPEEIRLAYDAIEHEDLKTSNALTFAFLDTSATEGPEELNNEPSAMAAGYASSSEENITAKQIATAIVLWGGAVQTCHDFYCWVKEKTGSSTSGNEDNRPTNPTFIDPKTGQPYTESYNQETGTVTRNYL